MAPTGEPSAGSDGRQGKQAVSALGRWRQEDHEFEGSLGYIEGSYLNSVPKKQDCVDKLGVDGCGRAG